MTIGSRRRAALAAGLLAGVCLLAAGCGPKPGKIANVARERHNLVYGHSNEGQALTEDVYSPQGRAKPVPIVIVVHGGGFINGDKQSIAPDALSFASVGYVTANVNYSLASPGYPEQVKEIQRAIRWTVDHARQFGADPHRVGIVGFSAGGYLGAMAALLDSEHQRGPVSAVVTLSAPLALPNLERLLHTRLAACGHRSLCPKRPHLPPLATFATVYRFLGCPTPKCSPKLVSRASPTSHVTPRAPAFLMFNSAHEVMPSSQATHMAKALRARGVPEQVTILPGTVHGIGYLERVSPAILKFLRQRLGNAPLRLAMGRGSQSSGSPTVLIICCVLLAAASLALVAAAVRKRTARAVL